MLLEFNFAVAHSSSIPSNLMICKNSRAAVNHSLVEINANNDIHKRRAAR